MSDLRNLDLNATDGGLKTQSLVRNSIPLVASTTYNQEFVGFFVNTPTASAWTITPIDANVTSAMVPVASTEYNLHCSAVTLPAGADGVGYLPGYKYELTDPISTWTLSGTSDTTNNVLTVAVGDSATLTSDSAVIPLVGETYNYSFDVTYGGATAATVTMGGETLYDKGATGQFSGKFTASAVTAFAVVLTTVATSDFTLSGLTIKRA